MLLVNDDNELIQRGNKYILNSDFTLALMSYEELEKSKPEDSLLAAAYNNMGVAHFLIAEGGFKRAWASER